MKLFLDGVQIEVFFCSMQVWIASFSQNAYVDDCPACSVNYRHMWWEYSDGSVINVLYWKGKQNTACLLMQCNLTFQLLCSH